MNTSVYTHTRSLKWALLAGIAALLSTAGLLLALSRSQAVAQPAAATADLQATKSVYPGWAPPGGYVTYTVHIVNSGESPVEGVWMTDDLPSEVSYTAGLDATAGDWGVTNNTITWTGSLSPTDGVIITFTVQISPSVSEGTHFTNTAVITGTGSPVQASVRATAVTTFYAYFPLVLKNYPPATILHSIVVPVVGSRHSYTVSWECGAVVDHYELQESTDANFGTFQTFTTTRVSLFFNKSNALKTFYYRVRANDGWGKGPWSNVQSVTTGYYDNFDSPSSGWPDDYWPVRDDKGMILTYRHRGYYGGDYQVIVPNPNSPWGWFKGLVALAPYSLPTDDPYCVQAGMRFYEYAPFGAEMALIFGADDSYRQFYALCFSAGETGMPLDWFIVRQDDYQIDSSDPAWRTAACVAAEYGIFGGHYDGRTSHIGWNHPRVCVNGNQATVYLAGEVAGSYNLAGLSNMTRVGVGNGVHEHLPVDVRVSFFQVTPYQP